MNFWIRVSLFIFLFGLPSFFALPANASTTCSQYQSNATAPNGYGLSWDPFSPTKEVLVRVDCSSEGARLFAGIPLNNDTGGPSSYYTYKLGYVYTSAGWQQVNLEPSSDISGSNRDGDWISGRAQSINLLPAITSSPTYVVGYVCTKQGGAWKCGCTNASCTTQGWQLQAYKDAAAGGTTSGGTTTGGSTGGTTQPAEFPKIEECGSTINVSPSNFSSNLGDGCKTLIMAPGTYSFDFSGHSGGVLTLRCSTKWACEVRVDSEIKESSGIIIDGIYMDGHCEGSGCRTAARRFLTLTNVSNIRIQNSKFNNMLGTGVLVNQSDENKQFNIQFVGNTLHNDIERSFQISGGGRYSYDMDYGFRIHDAKSVYIANNTFSGGFNHAVSLKRLVKYALIENNNFITCGNACIHVGQQGNTSDDPNISSDLAEIRNNAFGIEVRKDRSDGIEVMNIHKAVVTNNTFTGFIGDRALHLFYFSDGYNGLSGYINRGVPSDRQFIQSGNTIR